MLWALPACRAAEAGEVFSFQDYLNRDWKNESVHVALTPEQAARLKDNPALVGPGGDAVAYQVVPGATGQPAAIEFLANVKANEKSTYKWSDAAAPASASATDLKVAETVDSIRLTNKLTGITLRKKLEAGQGPIESIRLDSGQWVGGSRVGATLVPTGYSAKITQQGPVFCEVECRMEFGAGSSWTMTFRLDANEPVVIVNDKMELGEKEGTFSLSLSDNYNPDQLLYRLGLPAAGKTYGENESSEIKPGVAFVLEPWLRWWARPEQGAVFSVYRKDAPGMLSVGAGFAGQWVDPKIPGAMRSASFANLIKDDQGLHLDFAVKNGRHFWIIGSYDKDACLQVLKDPNLTSSTSIPHQYLIKHGQFPLNVVKDYVLNWDSSKESHPHLLITKEQVAKYRASYKKKPQEQDAELKRLGRPLNYVSMEVPLTQFYGAGNEAAGQMLVEDTQVMLQQAVDSLLYQPMLPYGAAPHNQQSYNFGLAPLVADAIIDSKVITPLQRKKILAQIAFCSYAINRPDYWSEERGFAANPNMTTTVLGYRVALGSVIATHPEAHEWVNDALKRLKFQLDNWSDENGGWLEAPHYAMVGYDAILGSALMAHNAGINDMVYDPQMKKVAYWFGKWSTPPDARYGGNRHLPPVGNSYIGEPTSEFGLLASIWKDKDPLFASQMEWMHLQQGSPTRPGLGGGYPVVAGYRKMLSELTPPPKAPVWGTEFFPKTGVLFRNKFPTDRETQMLLLGGSFGGWRSHYDDDSGSFTIWGKGRIVADDFGYYGAAPIEDHNMPMAAEMAQARIFDVQTYAPSKDFDYASGARGPWQRQIAFVKNGDPLAPNYFVVSDTFKTAAPATWRLWFTANKVMPEAGHALVEGKEDVDTDVFFATPAGLELKTEEKTRTAGSGYRPNGGEDATPTTQQGLIATAPQNGTMTYVLYPRLKTEKPPVFTSLGDGKVLCIQSDTGTDYVFLSATPFTWKQGTMSFEGKSGAIRFRGKKMVLSLGEAGSIEARGQTLTGKQGARKEFSLQ